MTEKDQAPTELRTEGAESSAETNVQDRSARTRATTVFQRLKELQATAGFLAVAVVYWTLYWTALGKLTDVYLALVGVALLGAIIYCGHAALASESSVVVLAVNAIVTVSLYALVFATAYYRVSSVTKCVKGELAPSCGFNEQLGKVEAAYFTMTTLTTTGYGDIVARTSGARLLVFCQMATGLVLVAGFLAAVAARFGRHRASKEDQQRHERP